MAACAKLSTQFPCQGKHENIALLSLLVIFSTHYWWKLWSGICRGFTSFTFSSSLNLLPARGGTLCSTWQGCSTPRDMTALDTLTQPQYTPHTPSPDPSSHFTLLLPILRSLRASTSTPSLPSSVLHSRLTWWQWWWWWWRQWWEKKQQWLLQEQSHRPPHHPDPVISCFYQYIWFVLPFNCSSIFMSIVFVDTSSGLCYIFQISKNLKTFL